MHIMEETNFFKKKFKKLTFKITLVFLFFRRWSRIIEEKAKFFFLSIYHKLKIYEITFFFLFLFRRYSPEQFNPLQVSENVRRLFRIRPTDGLTATKEGKLIILRSKWEKIFFSLKNALLFDALQKRVEKVVFYSFLTITLELNNPFDRNTLEFFLNKKIAFLERLLDYVKKINGKLWDQTEIKLHIRIFHRNSLFQSQVIRTMRQAVKKEKESALVIEAKEALKRGLYPVLVTVGVSGSYWMRGTDRQILGLFKPFDEEVHAPNNPVGPRYRGALGLRKTRRGCRVGESPHHEVGAYVVDEFFGFGIVPKTYYAEFTHHAFFLTRENLLSSRRAVKTKYGSFQEFVGGFVSLNKVAREEMASIPLDEFQLLVILDVIIGNTDRNIANILLGDEKIAAIDHGLCFPDRIDSFSYWYWSYLQQGKKPIFKPLVELLMNFPFDELERKLYKKCFISLNALHRMRERVVLFTQAVKADLVPSQLADLFTHEYLYPLIDRTTTLNDIAAQQIRLYMETLKTSL